MGWNKSLRNFFRRERRPEPLETVSPLAQAPSTSPASTHPDQPAATEVKPVFGASTENPCMKLVQKDEAKPTEKPNPFSKLVKEDEAKPKANPFSKLIEEQSEKPKANPFILGSSTSTQTPENPFSLKPKPASSAILATTQEQSKPPVEEKAEPKTEKVGSLKKAVTHRPKDADSSEPS